MQYFLLELEDEKYWLELDDNGYVTRQIVSDSRKELHVSCREDCLAEGTVDVEEMLGTIVKLSEWEFNDMWQSAISCYKKEWEKTKLKYPIGNYIQGICKFIYPQGAIIVGNDYMAVYKGNDDTEVNQLVSAKINMYDDVNMWLVLN